METLGKKIFSAVRAKAFKNVITQNCAYFFCNYGNAALVESYINEGFYLYNCYESLFYKININVRLRLRSN